MLVAGIGYQGRSADDFVAALRAAAIATVVDVRETPWSRRAEFSKKRLAERLAAEGIGYVHLRAAGNPRENRRAGGGTQEVLARYRELLAGAPDVIAEILALAKRHGRIALLCLERDPRECHRSVLLEALAARRPGLETAAL